jgi:hypothetical protein
MEPYMIDLFTCILAVVARVNQQGGGGVTPPTPTPGRATTGFNHRISSIVNSYHCNR